MKRLFFTLLLAVCVLTNFAGNLTSGNIVVVRVGDGSTALSSAAAPVYLDEYSPSGVLVQSIPMPVTDFQNNQTFTISGTATTEGSLTISADNSYLTLAGYDAAPGTAGISTATGIVRVIALVDALGNVNTQTGITLDSAYRNNSIRGAFTVNGSGFWCSGNGSGTSGGTFYVPSGGINNPVQLSAAPTNTRVVKGFNGQLYTSSASGSFNGINSVGLGFPTTNGQTTTLLPGLSSTAGLSVNGFAFFDLDPTVPGVDVLFVADERTTYPDGGIYKYSLVGGSWVSNGNITSSDPLRGITGMSNCAEVSLVVSSESTIYNMTDYFGYNQPISGSLNLLASAGTNKKFRGIAWAPGTFTSYGLYPSITSTNPTCAGSATGSATVVVAGTNGVPTYNWSNGAGTDVASNLTAGTYSVTVVDGAGCFGSATVTLTDPTAISISQTTTNVSCNGGANGMVSLSVSGGTGPYSYTWYDNTHSSSHSGLSAGNYTVTVADAHSCTVSATYSISQPNALSLSGQTIDATCAGIPTGAINVTTTGGTASYSYYWSNGLTTEDISNLQSGAYSLTVIDNNQCSASGSFTINQPTAISATGQISNPSCTSGNTSIIDLTTGGGTAPYYFNWSNGELTEDILALGSGIYAVTITDNNSCSASFSFTVNSDTLSVTAQQTNILCNGLNSGAITATPAGGTTPYSYSWSTGANGSTIDNLIAGTYSITVSDNSGCQISEMYTITEPAAITVTSTSVPVTCWGDQNGSLSLQVSGGMGPFSFSWSDGDTSQTRLNLNSASYVVTITDVNNCSVIHNDLVGTPQLLEVDLIPVDVTTVNGNDGQVESSTAGGVMPFTYQWNNGSTSSNLINVSAGTYCVTLTDAHGCTVSDCAQVQQPVGITEASNFSVVQSSIVATTLITTVTLQKAEMLNYQIGRAHV